MNAPAIRRLIQSKDFLIAGSLTLVCALTRFWAIPASLWEWDDILFARGLHMYDLAAHAPHPPGFPVYVIAARALNSVVHSDHLALALLSALLVSTLGALLYFLFIEIFDDRVTAAAGAWLTIFAPAILIHGSAPRSDPPGLAVGAIVLLLALRGFKRPNLIPFGFLALGLGMGVRVTVLAAAGPALVMVWAYWLVRKRWKIAAASVLAGVLGIISWFFPLVVYTGWARYFRVLRIHASYIMATDTVVSHTDIPRIIYRLKRYLVDIWGAAANAWVLYALVAAGILWLATRKKWRTLGWLSLGFLPYAAFSILDMIPFGAPFYAMPYMPFFAGLAACGLVGVFREAAYGLKQPRLRNAGLLVALLLGFASAYWSYPSMKLLRTEISPPVQAARSILQELDPQKDRLVYYGLFRPHVRYFFPQVQNSRLFGNNDLIPPALNLIDPVRNPGREFRLVKTPSLGLVEQHFHWTPGTGEQRLRTLSLGRYFDVYVSNSGESQRVAWLSGWGPQKIDNGRAWRWMGRSGRVALYISADEMTLRFSGRLTADLRNLPQAVIILRLDRKEIGRFVPEGETFEQTFNIKTDFSRFWSSLEIEVAGPASGISAELRFKDATKFLQCYGLEWTEASGAKKRTLATDEFVGEGWNRSEQNWRWTRERASVRLPQIDGDGVLSLSMRVPKKTDDKPTRVTIEVNGTPIDTFEAPVGKFMKTYRVPSTLSKSASTVLTLAVDRTKQESRKSRRLGICVYFIGWTPAGE